MSSTIDELSRRKNEYETQSPQAKMETLILGASNPLRAVSRHFGLDYADVLLYADSIRMKDYSNDLHESRATTRLADELGTKDSHSFTVFDRLVCATQTKLGRTLDEYV